MARQEIRLPDMGEGVESATVVSILVSEGDEVQEEQALMELETEKAVSEVPSPAAGKVVEIHVRRDQEISPGDLLLTLEVSSEKAGEPEETAPAAGKGQEQEAELETEEAKGKKTADKGTAEAGKPQGQEPPAEEAKSQATETKAVKRSNEDRARAAEGKAARGGWAPGTESPAGPGARRLARELGIDLRQVAGSGPGGRIREDDVVAAARDASRERAERGDEWGPVRREKMSSIRKTIARRMHEARASAAHATNTDDADITELLAFYHGATEEAGARLSMLAFVVRAVAGLLEQHPLINASLDLESAEIIYKEYVNIGIAVDTERGLLVPVIRNVDRMSIAEITRAMEWASERARSGKLELSDFKGGTFTISNLGAIGGRYAAPIINYPESAILLLGRARRAPVVIDENIRIRTIMPLSLSYDHRLIDGAEAARFLNELIACLQSPPRLLTR